MIVEEHETIKSSVEGNPEQKAEVVLTILSQFSQSAKVAKPKQKRRLAAQWETRCIEKRL